MKIVLISGVAMLPAHEGNRSRILALTRAIRNQGHDLWVVTLPANISEPADPTLHTAEFGNNRFLELAPEHPIKKFFLTLPERIYRKILKTFNNSKQYYSSLDYLYAKSWNNQLTDLHRKIEFDVAIVEYVFHSAAFLAFPKNVKKVLDTHDAFADRHIPYLNRGLTDYFVSMSPQQENRGFRRADKILAIQELEAEKFKKQLGNHRKNPGISIVSHFNDLTMEVVKDHSPKNALFLGSSNSSNTHGVKEFIEFVLPKVLEKIPEFKLLLAGKICTTVDDHHAVIKLGHVNKVIDAFVKAPLLINPILIGTGINIKILDAMTAGVPVISTDTGVRGLPQEYRDFVITVSAGNHQEFSNEIVSLIGDIELKRKLGLKARSNAEKWNAAQNATLLSAIEQ